MRLASAAPLGIAMALIAGPWVAPVASAEPPMRIVEDAGSWKVLIGGLLGIYVVTQADQVAVGIAPAHDGLYVYANIPDAGLEAITMQFDTGAKYTLAAQVAAGAPTYKVLVGASDSTLFIHALTAGKAAKIIAGPNTYPIPLAGTAPAIDALNFYGKEHDLGLPPPFTAAKPYGSAPGQTQAAARPAPPQPAPPASSASSSDRKPAADATFDGSYGAPTTPRMGNLTLSDFAIGVKRAEYPDGLDVSFVTRLSNNSETRWKASTCIRYYDSRNLEIDHDFGGAVNIGPTQSDLSNGHTRMAPNLWAQVVTIRAYAAAYGCADSSGEAISPVLTLNRR